MPKYLILDLETTTKKVHGRKANPFYNDIVAVGLKYQDKNEATTIKGDYLDDHVLQGVLDKADILIGHNLTFDLLYLWKYRAFQEWLESGGKIYDTQLAEYMLSGQQHKFPALRDIAVNKYECKEREKVMEKYWDQGIDTKDIPIDKVLFDVENDVLDTEQVMLQQVKEAKKEGLFNLIMERMDGLLATIEMEFNGLYVNQKIMQRNKEALVKELDELYIQVYKIANDYWDTKNLNINSATQLSILFFGGFVNRIRYVPIKNEFGIEQVYKSGSQKGEIRMKQEKAKVFIKGFGLTPLDEWKTGKVGVYSTNEKVLRIITSKKNHVAALLARIMLSIREKGTLLKTFYKGFERFIYADGFIRSNFNHTITDTGRLSSSEPNFQNIPR